MNDDFCSYEIAKKLKAMVFDRPCSHYYTKENASDDDVWLTTTAFTPEDWNDGRNGEPDFFKPLCSAPNLWEAQKWLREKKGIYVYPEINMLKKWFAKAVDVCNNEDMIWDGTTFDTYESALSAGIEAALQLIETGYNPTLIA